MKIMLTLALAFLTACTRPCATVTPPLSPDKLRAQSVQECHDRGDDTPKCVQTQYAANIGWYYYRNPEVKR